MLAELRQRLRVIGRVANDSFEMPLTQEQVGEALGITAVHANRVIKQLRQDGIVDLHRGSVTVLDEAKFQELADFDARYLHLSPDSGRRYVSADKAFRTMATGEDSVGRTGQVRESFSR